MTEDVTAGPGRAQSFWFHLRPDPKLTGDRLRAQAARHRHIVLNAKDHGRLRDIRSGNPRAEVFVYKDISSTRSYACKDGVDEPYLPTGVGYCHADRHHRGWFLLDGKGERLRYQGYSGHWQMDVGRDDYLTCWVDDVVEEAGKLRFDGVYLDNALVAADDYHPGTVPAKYPTNALMQDAYADALAHVHGRLGEKGLRVAANIANARLHRGVWQRYVEHLDVGVDEWWVALGKGNLLPDYAEGWRRQVEEIAHDEALGKGTWVQPHFPREDRRALWYSMASYFLATGGHAMITEIDRTDDHTTLPPERAVYGWDLGEPREAHHETAQGSGLFRRRFTRGLALVNANKEGSRTVAVDGGHVDMDDRDVTSPVTLPALTGMVLRRKS
ncbi:MAG: hypothetical protein HOV94_03370 [Saccharothrix sp.]|nr:hypothetical protein [Saccharothrix sp.]